jgi:hypothetical protein
MKSASVPQAAFPFVAVGVGITGVVGVLLAALAAQQLILLLANAPRPFECPQFVVMLVLSLTLPLACFYSLNMAVDHFRRSSVRGAYAWLVLPMANVIAIVGLFMLPPCIGGN